MLIINCRSKYSKGDSGVISIHQMLIINEMNGWNYGKNQNDFNTSNVNNQRINSIKRTIRKNISIHQMLIINKGLMGK